MAMMRPTRSRPTPALRGIVLTCALAAVTLSACTTNEDPATREDYQQTLTDAGLEESVMARDWIAAGTEALANPTAIGLPHTESGVFFAHETRAIGLAFDAVAGQRLQASVELDASAQGRLFVDLVRLQDSGRSGSSHEFLLRTTDPDNIDLVFEQSGRYLLRLQPELLAQISYELRVELGAALPFPVSGESNRALGSYFGDARDGGARQHEGVDIFAPRMTPVIAVTSGTARAGRNRLGGNVVWLRADGARYYYAHLDSVAFDGRQRVEPGDVIGYVGNTGNARTTPPHLHFGVYRSYRGAVDPLPYLQSHELPDEIGNPEFRSRYIETTASALNLRAAPRVVADNILTSLPAGTVAQSLAVSGDWLLVRTVDGRRGWIADAYSQDLSAASERLVASRSHLVYPHPDIESQSAIAHLDTGTPLGVFARLRDAILVGFVGQTPLGWIRAAA